MNTQPSTLATPIDVSTDVAAVWREQEAALRSRLAAPGIVDRDRMRALTGMEFFAAMSRGEFPSVHFGRTLGFSAIEFDYGRFVFQGEPTLDHYNPLGMVHGGYIATLLDSCVGCAVHTTLPAGKGYTTLELKINYIRAVTTRTGPVRAEGKVIHVGNQAGVAEGRLTDSQGKLLAHATTTCLVFPI